MVLPRALIRWWIRNAASLDAFEHVLVSSFVVGLVSGALLGALACYLARHA